MAQRRMFSPQIVESEEFLTMPVSSQALYFHLGMNADDDGFIQPKIIMRTTGANDDDLKVLLSKRFLLAFEGGVVVIKHWLIHNLIQKDRYHSTRFIDQKKLLLIKENKAYTEIGNPVNKMLTEVRLSKVNIREKAENSLSYLKEIPEQDLEEMYNRFDCDKHAISGKAESLYLYCQSKGKVYKNYHALLLNALKKDFPERKEKPQSKKVVMIEGKPTLLS